MNEQVRTLNEKDRLLLPPFQPTRVCLGTLLLLTHFPGSVENILSSEPGLLEPAPERQSREAGGRGCGSLRALS